MKGCVVCNGEIRDHQTAESQIRECELVIAADGGAEHLRVMGFDPHAVVGDMDSIRQPVSEGVETIRFPRDKDETDAELAVRIAFERGCKFVSLLGALGGRLDHMLGNIGLVAKYPRRIAILEGNSTLVAVDASERCRIEGEEGSIVSLIPFPAAEKVTTTGLKYPLAKEDLLPGTRGISNVLIGRDGCVCIDAGLLLVYVQRSGVQK